MWAISLLTILLLLPLLSAAPLNIAGGVKDDNDGMHSHDENVTRGGKFFGHNQFDVGNINVSGSVAGDVVSIGHEVNIDVHVTHDHHHHHEDDTVIECKEGLREMFKSIDSNKNGLMDAKELLRVCHQNNVQITESLAVRILTLPDKTVGFHMAKFCELLKDCPSNNSAGLIHFLLQLFDKAPCSGTASDWHCCSSTSPCQENEGDCDTDDDCVGSLVCGEDNCKSINPLAHHLADCCIQPVTIEEQREFSPQRPQPKVTIEEQREFSPPRPQPKEPCDGIDNGCCTKENPCEEYDGDCDNNDECEADLICGTDNCAWGDGDDCCFKKGGPCKGMKNCCSKESPCKEDDGDCDNNDQCEGDLLCGENNCDWGDGDDCCFKKGGPCNGIEDGCCTAENPCKENDGDCDSDDQCAGDLLCGTKNCPWGRLEDGGDCCYKKIGTCNGKEDCCSAEKPCKEQDGPCKTDDQCTGDLRCGDQNCMWGGADDQKDNCCYKRGGPCTGVDNGCCTATTPCKEKDGDCDNDNECAGHLLCGTDNCPWGDGDDCCYSLDAAQCG